VFSGLVTLTWQQKSFIELSSREKWLLTSSTFLGVPVRLKPLRSARKKTISLVCQLFVFIYRFALEHLILCIFRLCDSAEQTCEIFN